MHLTNCAHACAFAGAAHAPPKDAYIICVKDGNLHVDPPAGGDVIVNKVAVQKRIRSLEDDVEELTWPWWQHPFIILIAVLTRRR